MASVTAASIARAADALPIAGSVAQSSQVSDGLTAESMAATENSLTSTLFNLTINSTDYTLLSSSALDFDSDYTPPEGYDDGYSDKISDAFFTQLSTDDFKIRSFSSFEQYEDDEDGNPQSVVLDPATHDIIIADIYSNRANAEDTDYLAFGIWFRVPATMWQYVPGRQGSVELRPGIGPENLQVGAFADGGDPFTQSNLPGVQGSASYAGNVVAIYALDGTADFLDNLNLPDDHKNFLAEGGFFPDVHMYGDIDLTANFGNGTALGTISGTITEMKLSAYPDEPDEIKEEGYTPPMHNYPGTLTLGEAPIGDDEHGFFTGRLTGSSGSRTYTGNWGGQFHGNGGDQPGSVAGTFGAKSSDGKMSFLGSFGALKEDDN